MPHSKNFLKDVLIAWEHVPYLSSSSVVFSLKRRYMYLYLCTFIARPLLFKISANSRVFRYNTPLYVVWRSASYQAS